jgi:hypothetical protein
MSGPVSNPPEESEKDCSAGAAGSEPPRDQKGILRNIELAGGLGWYMYMVGLGDGRRTEFCKNGWRGNHHRKIWRKKKS